MSNYQIIGLSFAAVGILSLASMAIEGFRKGNLELRMMPITNLLMWVSRILIGVLFLYSGFVKANDFIGFAYKLEEYFQVFGEHWPALAGFFNFFIPFANPLAWLISVFEMALAIAILIGWRMPVTLTLSMLMMVFFTILTGYSHVTGAVGDCGCFGDALKLEPWESFVKDLILMGMLIPMFIFRKQIRPYPNDRTTTWITAGSFVVFGFFSWYCFYNLPLVDYRPYKVGANLAVCTTEIQADGFPKCKDWDPYFLPDQSTDLFEGKKLLIISYTLDFASEKGLKASGDLARALEGSGVEVWGLTATAPSGVETLSKKLNLGYPFAFIDQTALKTVIRSNPGYMLLNNGVVVKKWHYHNAPSVEAVKKLVP